MTAYISPTDDAKAALHFFDEIVKGCPFDDPAAVTLTFHVFTAEQLPWLEIADALPRYEHSSRDAIPVSHGPRPPGSPIRPNPSWPHVRVRSGCAARFWTGAFLAQPRRLSGV